tara:strand:+ start:290 stop:613 length:324 start_codon:yes stop_codon:yes gene_type:complete
MKSINLSLLFFFLFSINSYSLPPCEDDYSHFWDNCEGTITFDNGIKYEGEWKYGKSHGKGTATFANGDKYVGEWKNSLPNGKGTYTSANGEKYVGEFKDGIPIELIR